jgi:hypothetical protein
VRRQNCVGCHEIEGDGGDYRTVVTDPTLAPPMLTPEGAKVQPDWVYAFFQGPITIRPWLNVRMPTFGLDDGRWNAIIDYFEATGNSIGSFRTYDHAELTRQAVPGRDLFTCCAASSAVLGSTPADQPLSNLAPDLLTHERPAGGILDWLRNPKNSARHADAAILADAAVYEVVVPATGRRRRTADAGDSGSSHDAAGRAIATAAHRSSAEYELIWLWALALGLM